MKTWKLGHSDVEVSALSYGTDLIGSRIDRETSFTLFDLFYDRGGTFLDTANFYSSWVEGCSGGESETTIGQWMKERGVRDKIQISSKLGFDYPGSDGGLSADEIERECEKSLARLPDRLYRCLLCPPGRFRYAHGRNHGGIPPADSKGQGAYDRCE